MDELNQSYLKSQIIPEGKTGKFPICISSSTESTINEKISYLINNTHLFNLKSNFIFRIIKIILNYKTIARSRNLNNKSKSKNSSNRTRTFKNPFIF